MLESPVTEVTQQLYECIECSYQSEWAFDIDHHVQRKHHNVYVAELHHSTGELEQFPCTWCEFKSRYKLRLYEHCKQKHDDADVSCEPFDLYKCNLCNFLACSSLRMVKHLEGCGCGVVNKLPELLENCKVFETPHKIDHDVDITILEKFVKSLPKLELLLSTDQNVLRARAVVAYCRGAFQDVYSILQSHIFSQRYHKQLQTLWFKAHYREAQQERSTPLGAVSKYRIRKRHPPPKTIWDGEETLYCINKRARDVLMEFYLWRQYPTPREKKDLAIKLGMTVWQVSNWFKNKRQRSRSRNNSLPSVPSDTSAIPLPNRIEL